MMATEHSVETSTDAQKLCGRRRQQMLSMCQLTTIMLSVIPEDRSKDAWIAAKLKQGGKHPEPPEYSHVSEKASREKI